MLAVVETHPVQYHAPVYREVTRRGVPMTAIYGSDFSVAGYRDPEFGAAFAWDVDLLDGYESIFLSRVGEGGATDDQMVGAAGIQRALADARPDAVLVLGYSPAFHRAAWRAAWRLGVPILFRGEASDEARDRSVARSLARRAALTVAYRSCARCLYIGEQARRHYIRHGVPAERLLFSPYCVDATPFEPDEVARARYRQATRAQLGIAADQQVVLFSGKLSPRKGVDVLVSAAATLDAARRASLVVVFLGDGALREELSAQAGAAGVQVRFAGFRNQRELSPVFHAADVLCLPSRHSETWGLVVNEALAHGLPVVTSDRVGCHPDLVIANRTGATARAGDPVDLARSILEGLRLSAEPGARDACRETATRYSVSAAADGIVEAYRGVVASASPVA